MKCWYWSGWFFQGDILSPFVCDILWTNSTDRRYNSSRSIRVFTSLFIAVSFWELNRSLHPLLSWGVPNLISLQFGHKLHSITHKDDTLHSFRAHTKKTELTLSSASYKFDVLKCGGLIDSLTRALQRYNVNNMQLNYELLSRPAACFSFIFINIDDRLLSIFPPNSCQKWR